MSNRKTNSVKGSRRRGRTSGRNRARDWHKSWLEYRARKLSLVGTLIAILVLANCGASDFASQLRIIVAASGPLINSLNLGDKKAAVIQDFADIASGAADLSTDLKACAQDKPCKIAAIERFEHRFWDIQRRGHFKLSPKLQNVESILQSVIAAAKVYYGGGKTPQAAARGPVSSANPASDLKQKLDELRAAMKP